MSKPKSESKPKGRGRRWGLALLVLVAWLGTGGWAYHDVETRSERARVSTAEALEATASVTNLLFLAEQGRVDGELERLRTELRAQAVWAKVDLAAGLDEDEPSAVDARRLDALMRRGLSDGPSLAALELIVAGHDGLSVRGFARDGETLLRSQWAPKEREGVAKALWYSDEVQRSVASSGRRVERGEVSFEGEIERPRVRAAIGLHDPGELVQGVLVASVDLTPLAAQLGDLAKRGERVTLVGFDGRPLDPTQSGEAERARLAALTARVLEADTPPDAFEAAGAMVLGRPMAHLDGSVSDLVLLIETDGVPSGVLAWLDTAWPAPLVLISILSPLAIVLLLRGREQILAPDAPGRVRAGRAGADSRTDTSSPGLDSITVSTEAFALRDWLSDVRACLEREAATRGLALDVRCERSLPDQVEADPGWLGGLLVAMGREALDATSEDRVTLDVLEDAGESVRFEVDAGGAVLSPVRGMRAVATSVGGRIESASEGRLALVIPSILE